MSTDEDYYIRQYPVSISCGCKVRQQSQDCYFRLRHLLSMSHFSFFHSLSHLSIVSHYIGNQKASSAHSPTLLSNCYNHHSHTTFVASTDLPRGAPGTRYQKPLPNHQQLFGHQPCAPTTPSASLPAATPFYESRALAISAGTIPLIAATASASFEWQSACQQTPSARTVNTE